MLFASGPGDQGRCARTWTWEFVLVKSLCPRVQDPVTRDDTHEPGHESLCRWNHCVLQSWDNRSGELDLKAINESTACAGPRDLWRDDTHEPGPTGHAHWPAGVDGSGAGPPQDLRAGTVEPAVPHLWGGRREPQVIIIIIYLFSTYLSLPVRTQLVRLSTGHSAMWTTNQCGFFCFVWSLVVVLSLRKALCVESSDVLSTILCGEYIFTASIIYFYLFF